MSILRDAIQPQKTYKTQGGKLVYVQDIVDWANGRKVIYCQVGSVHRQECALSRFAAQLVSIEPNQ